LGVMLAYTLHASGVWTPVVAL